MTRRQYLANRLAKRQEWAQKAAAKSEQTFASVHQLADSIPLGQPILLNHHSERHARRDAGRIFNGMGKAVELGKLAEHHTQAASGLASQLDKSIFSDDDNAIAALESRIAEREAKAAHMVALNKAWRASKGDVTKFATLAGIPQATAQRMADQIAEAYSWEKQPVPAYELSNLRATIRTDKQRIEEIKRRAERSEKAENAGGILVTGQEYVSVTFADKPEREIIDRLKVAGYYWSGGSWHGKRESLPDLS